ncbi:MAG: hypothetical protein ACI4VK_02155 [Candidatus Coproplasma sp.]
MKLLELIGNLICFWVKIERRYDAINRDEEKRDKSVKLGVRSIIQSVICGVVIILLIWGLFLCLNHLESIKIGDGTYSAPFLTILGIVVCALCAVVLLFDGMFGALVYMVYQSKLNKKGIRWVALAVWLVMIVAIIIFALIMFLNFK